MVSEVMAIVFDREDSVWDPMALLRWHARDQGLKSPAVAGNESPAVADKGRAPGLEIIGSMFLVERMGEEKEDVPLQATTLHLGSVAKTRRRRGAIM